MDIIKSMSIIMRVKDFGESDLLITFFTPDEGKIKGIAKGARRSRARFVNCLDIFSLESGIQPEKERRPVFHTLGETPERISGPEEKLRDTYKGQLHDRVDRNTVSVAASGQGHV